MTSIASMTAISAAFHRRSLGVLRILETRLGRLLAFWLALAGLASILRIVASPIDVGAMGSATLLPYLLLIGAPALSLLLAMRWFRDAEEMPQPRTRLAAVGRWRTISADEARRNRLYGTSGIMVSLLVGMLLNVPIRAAEYLATMPAITAAAPQWLAGLHFWMTLDAVLMSSLYVICFAAAIRRMPLFPRLLLAVWMLDILMKLLIAQGAVATGIPADVADPLHILLEKNVTKVLISIGLWLPYLILSERVNVTYRHRVAA